MKKAYIVKLIDGDNDTIMKLVDQETWDWIMANKSGQPAETKITKFKFFTTGKISSRWNDTLCPDSIRERIKREQESNDSDFDGVWITQGSWRNDRAILAPVLEDNYSDFSCYYTTTSEVIKMINTAKEKEYDVDMENEYQGVMY